MRRPNNNLTKITPRAITIPAENPEQTKTKTVISFKLLPLRFVSHQDVSDSSILEENGCVTVQQKGICPTKPEDPNRHYETSRS